MCDGFGLDYREVGVNIITNTKTITLCRNCLAQAITSHTLEIDEGCYVSELSS